MMHKQCPFCGERDSFAFVIDIGQGYKYGCVECGNCLAKGPEVRTNYRNGDKEEWHNDALNA